MELSKIKILFLHNIIAPYRTPLFEELSKKYDIQVVFLEKKDKHRKWNQDSKKLNFKHKFLKNKNYFLFGKKITINTGLKNIITEYNPDILITLDNPPNFLTVAYSTYLAKKRFIPIILWTGAFNEYKTFQNNTIKQSLILSAIKVFRKYIYSNVNYYWAYSKATKKYLIDEYNITANKIFEGLQGYPDSLIYFEKVDFEQRFKDNKILFIGYLDERKGIKMLLLVFQDLLKEFPDYQLEIIGTGVIYEKIVDEYKAISNIKFLGYKDGIEKFKIINKSKYLVLPSYSDPWGWVVNEVASCKVPALVSDSVMAKEILEDDRLITETRSSNNLKTKLRRLMLLPYKDYKSMSEKVYKSSRSHTLDKSLKSFDAIIKELKW